MSSPPARVGQSERLLSPVEVEAVLARAIELHLRAPAQAGNEQISEGELLRIGHELGLSPATVLQALAEVDGGIGEEAGWLARHLGARRAGASRVVVRSPDDVQRDIESYLLRVECMVIERRLPGRTAYTPAAGLAASATRIAHRLAGRHPLLRADRVEVGMQAVEGGSCCVAVTVDLTRKRRESAALALLGGGAGAGVAVAAGLLVAPVAALVGLPLAVGAVAGFRTAYRSAVAGAGSRVESLLDRLQHEELDVRVFARRPRMLGF